MEEAQVDGLGGGEAGDVVGEQATSTAGSDESAQGEASTFQGREMTTMLPTSPNWYCGQVADCSLDGVYAYGAKADVQLLHIKSRKFVGALRGHEDRITSLEIDKRSGSRGGLHCVSGAADATVRVWDMRTLQCLAQHRLHKGVVVALSVSPLSADLLVVSADKSGVVVLWRFPAEGATVRGDGSITRVFTTKEKWGIDSAVQCLKCSPYNEDEVAVGFQNGVVIVADIKEGTVLHRLTGHVEEIHALSWLPPRFAKQQEKKVSKADDDGSSWRRSKDEEEEGDNTDEAEKLGEGEGEAEVHTANATTSGVTSSWRVTPLLASSSRDQTIRIWNAQTGKFHCMMRLPAGRRGARDKTGLWLSIAWSWCKRNQLVSTSNDDELLLWDINDKKKPSSNRLTGAGHNRAIFGITFLPDDPRQFVTHSMDRQIILWNCVKLKSVWSIPTLGGFAYSLDYSEMDPTKLAVALGDKSIRIWDISEATSREADDGEEGGASNKNPYRTILLWKGLQAKVTCVAWHPTSIGTLAYGMDDGRVGVYNTHSQTVAQFAGHHARGPVYELGWHVAADASTEPAKEVSGPGNEKKDEKEEEDNSEQHQQQGEEGKAGLGGKKRYLLYSCGGDGNILEFDPAKPNKFPKNINLHIGSANATTEVKERPTFPKRSDFAWKKDGTLLAVGNSNGTIELFEYPSWRCLRVFSDHRKLINRLKWNSAAEGECGTAASSLYWGNLLASASDDNSILIYDVTTIIAGGGKGVAPSLVGTSEECIRVLKGHTRSVTDIAWCPHNPELIASASMDATVQVWNALTGTPLANYRHHAGRVFGVRWNGLDSRFLFSASEDQTTHMWNYLRQPHTAPPVLEPLPRKKKPAAKKDAGGGAKKPPAPKKAPVPTTSGTTEPPSMHVSQAPAAEPKGPAPPLSTTADERRTELGGDQVADASVQAQTGEEEQVPPATTTEQVDTTTATAMATKRGGKKKTATKKERTLLPMSNNALQSRQQQVEVCKAIAREMFKHQTQNAAEADDDVDVYHRPTTQPTEKEAAEPSKALEPGAEAQPVASSPGPTKGHLQEVNLFMGDKEALDLLQAEGAAQSESGNWESSAMLAMWQGDVGAALRQTVQKDGLSAMWVALSPLAGRDVWEAMCVAYAYQLQQAGDVHKAVLFFLTCHRVADAVKVYTEAEMFREAILLAKTRLESNDPLIRELYLEWAEWCERRAMYEQVAKCYLALGNIDKAIQYLARKGDALGLDAALDLALLAGKSEAALTLATTYAKMCMYNTRSFDKAFELYAKFPTLYANLYLLGVEQALWEEANDKPEQEQPEAEAAASPPTPSLPSFIHIFFPSASRFLARLRRSEAEPHFFEKVYLAWQGRGLPLDKVSLEAKRDELLRRSHQHLADVVSPGGPRTRHDNKVAHSTYLCLALISFLLDDVEGGLRYCLQPLLAGGADEVTQLRLFSLCFPGSWHTLRDLFVGFGIGRAQKSEESESESENENEERRVRVPADLLPTLRSFGACAELLDRLLAVSPAAVDFVFATTTATAEEGEETPTGQVKVSEELLRLRRQRRRAEGEAAEVVVEETRRVVEELTPVVCDSLVAEWHDMHARRRTLAKRAARLCADTQTTTTTERSTALAQESAHLQAAIQRVEQKLIRNEDDDEENVEAATEPGRKPGLVLPHPECGATLLLVLCGELGLLPQARVVCEWMAQQQQQRLHDGTSPPANEDAASSSSRGDGAADNRPTTARMMRAKWQAAVDRYSRMFAAARS